MKGNPEKRKTREKLYKYKKTPKNSKQVLTIYHLLLNLLPCEKQERQITPCN